MGGYSVEFAFDQLASLAHGCWHYDAKAGCDVADVVCPSCGPYRKAAHQRQKKLRLFGHDDHAFIGYQCAHCNEHGFVHDDDKPRPSRAQVEQFRATSAKQHEIARVKRLGTAHWLWGQRRPPGRTVVETYLRARGYLGPIPRTIGFLPATKGYAPSMIAVYGVAHEIAPGEIDIADAAVTGVHITRLLPDGTWRERSGDAKIAIGNDITEPIVLAPPTDLLSLGIVEGIEKGLILHQDTGCGVWAAGCAGKLPKLAQHVPRFISSVTIIVDPDIDGRRNSEALGDLLLDHGFDVRLTGGAS